MEKVTRKEADEIEARILAEKEMDRLKSKEYWKKRNANDIANRAKASKNRAAQRRRRKKSR
jgi:hypothetical protein